MKARVLTPADFTDSLVVELDDTTRLFVLGLYLVADDHGVVIDDAVAVNKELFPAQPPRPVSEMLDLLSMVGVVQRMVAPDGTRVVLLGDFAAHRKDAKRTKSKWGSPQRFMPLPLPSVAERNAVQSKFSVPDDGTRVSVQCEVCQGVNGTIRFIAPALGLDEFFGGALVADRLEIQPARLDEPMQLVCRSCRNDVTYIEPAVADSADVVDMQAKRIRQVFEVWLKETGRTSQTQLDGNRRGVIERALAAYPTDDVLDALRGWKNDPFYCGENDRGRAYNDITLLLRDAAHIEQFRDLARSGPVRRGGLRKASGNVSSFEGESRVGDWD